MENHHHCHICGNMISPSRQFCADCAEKRRDKSKLLRPKLSPALEEAIEEFIERQARRKAETKLKD